MLNFSINFGNILTDLRAVIADHAARTRARVALFDLLWHRLGRVTKRLESLVAKWRNGTLPTPHPRRAAPPVLTEGLGREADQAEGGTPQTPKPTPKPYIPQGNSWLVAAIGYQAAGRALQLQHLMAQPEFTEFLQAVPRAGRLLRPLCRMLGIPVPEPIRLPPRPRAPRKPRPPRPAKIPLWQCYPQGIRRYRHLYPDPPRRKKSPA